MQLHIRWLKCLEPILTLLTIQQVDILSIRNLVQVLTADFLSTRDSSAGRAEDCSWLLISEILRSVVQIRLAREE